MFASKSNWLAHMGTQHRLKWQCVATGHDPILFNDEELFIGHMESAHPGTFRGDKLRFIADSSAHVSLPIITDCPFCIVSRSDEDLEEHVVRHLYHFALQSIPEHQVEVHQSGSEITDKGGISRYSLHQADGRVAAAKAPGDWNTAGKAHTASIGSEAHGWFQNPARTEQAETEAHDDPILNSPPMTPTESTAP